MQIRRKMTEIMVNQASSCDLKDLVQKFIPEVIGKEIEKATTSIFPLQNVFIRKVKILKAPKFDLGKLMEVLPFLCVVWKLLPSTKLKLLGRAGSWRLQGGCWSQVRSTCWGRPSGGRIWSCRCLTSCCTLTSISQIWFEFWRVFIFLPVLIAYNYFKR